jgi:dihydrofolate synthase/folylpolyglutamate synthase
MSSLDYLLSFQKFGIKLGLDNIAHLLERLGNPHHEFPAIHVGGTNGKGSVVAFIHSALVAMGYKVGRFTSPHLIHFSERIVIDNTPINDTQLDVLIQRLRPIVEEMKGDPLYGHPTFFEAVTAIAFLHFAMEKVDFAVVEVGMGGRYDSTNVVRPCVTVINNVSVEHRDYLGETLAEIAVEKAGIIKPGIDMVSAKQEAEAKNVIDARVGECNVKAYFFPTDFHCDARRDAFPRQWVNFEGPWNRLEDVEINLAGGFQARNAAVALMALEILQHKGIVARNEAALRKGMAETHWPARIEKLADSPLIILDSAHNPAAMAALVESVLELFPGRRIVPVVGMLKDKDIAESLRILRKLGDTIVVGQPAYERALPSAELANAAEGIFTDVRHERTMTSAIERALASVRDRDMILITGSLFNVAEAKGVMALSDASTS